MAKPPKKPLTDAQLQARAQAAQKREVRGIFQGAGFVRSLILEEKEVVFEGTTCDLDDVFIINNIVVLAEYTISKEDKLSAHLKKKKVFFDKVNLNQGRFVEYLRGKFPECASEISSEFTKSQYRVIIVYCSRNAVKGTLKLEVPDVVYLDYNHVQYFKYVTSAIKKSALAEVLHFLGVPYKHYGPNVKKPAAGGHQQYPGSLLPEDHSNLKSGYKVVSFYVDPEALLDRAYVLRQDSWRETDMPYQRMIQKKKINALRRYHIKEKRVFLNNIIATLPANTKLIDDSGNTKNPALANSTEAIVVQLPSEYNSVGIIDGQHRLFSYYDGEPGNAEVSSLRGMQNLLLTGIIFPDSATPSERAQFEANLFLEINATQTSASPDVTQAIELILRPFSPQSLARELVKRLNKGAGPLSDEFAQYFYDTEKLKPTSIVSYGLKPFLKLGGSDSAFSKWGSADKEKLSLSNDFDLRNEYLTFSTSLLETFLIAVRKNVPSDLWTSNPSVLGRMLTTTYVNGYIACLRHLINFGKPLAPEQLAHQLQNLRG